MPKVVQDDKKEVVNYLARLDEFHLGERSRKILIDYFKFLSRKEKIERKLAYNFMIHCDDNTRTKKFITILSETVNAICKKTDSAAILSEIDFLENPSAALSVMEQSSIFAICECLSQGQFAPQIGGSRTDELKRDRNTAWNQYLQMCEKTQGTCKIIAAPEHVLRERFRNNEHLYFRIFRNHIYVDGMSSDEIYELTITEIKKSGIACSEEFEEQLEKYIQVIY